MTNLAETQPFTFNAKSALKRTAPLVLWFVGGLALSRILYEGFFPSLLWLGRPLFALPFAIIISTAGSRFWRRRNLPLSALLPLLLNLLYLFDPTIDLVASRFIFFAAVWLAALLLAHTLAPHAAWRWLGILFVLAALLPIYLLTMPAAVGQADTFEFQVVVPQLGIAHPTGYPLYLLLGKLFTLLPLGTVAWRLNAATMLYGLAAVSLLFVLGYRLGVKPVTAVLAATLFGLIPTFWSQAIEAEVYSLQTLIVVGAFLLMRESGGWRVGLVDGGQGTVNSEQWTVNSGQFTVDSGQWTGDRRRWLSISLAFVLGLGMTNHLTTLFLLPAATLTLLFTHTFTRQQSVLSNLKTFLTLALAFCLPLLLYAYLPLRWQAIHQEPMGVARFLDWVIGGRFQGALQWRAWLDDLTRYEVVGRIILANWGYVNLFVALLGFFFTWRRRWRWALILTVTWLGYIFYALNYYVPDLDVFIIGAQVVVALWWLAGANAILEIGERSLSLSKVAFANLLILLLLLPTLLGASQNWNRLDQSRDDGGQPWGEGVLALPLAEGAAILADSEKIAPLYYLQQAEGVRPDLDIMVLPDEAAYRAELDGRLAAGQTVYLARFLPGLAGIYHLRSLGPLVEVSPEAVTTLQTVSTSSRQAVSTSSRQAVSSPLPFGPIQLLGYQLDAVSPFDDTQTAVTLYWQATEPVTQPLHVYLRLGDDISSGQHPANNSYPTNAWEVGEIVPDFHQLPRPRLFTRKAAIIEVALAPPFTPVSKLEWQPVASFWPSEAPVSVPAATTLRHQIGQIILNGVNFPTQIRPRAALPVQLTGWGKELNKLNMQLRPAGKDFPETPYSSYLNPTWPSRERPFFTLSTLLDSNQPAGRYEIVAYAAGGCHMGREECNYPASYCGWFSLRQEGCVIGEVDMRGVALPETAVNFNDQIALLNIDIANQPLTPGGSLPLSLHWLSLAPLGDDYTLFLQVVDANDRIVGQIDAWPLQGTLPTSQWQPGQTLTDPYTIPLDNNLPPGEYRLLIGWYLLADLRRLPILNADGRAIDDKLILPGFTVSH